MSCQVCHSQPYKNCFSCHTDVTEDDEAKLCFMGHAPMENRNGLVVDNRLSLVNGTAEWEAALEMVKYLPGANRITVGGDKGYDVPIFGWVKITGCLLKRLHSSIRCYFHYHFDVDASGWNW